MLVAGAGGGVFWWYLEACQPPPKAPACPIHIDIPPRMNPRQIGSALREAGVIRSALWFRALIHWYGVAHRLQPGSFTFSGRETPEEVIGALLEPQTVTERVTIPEGLTLGDIGLILESNGIVSAASFTTAINSPALLASVFPTWGPIPHAEGLAFPETYQFTPGMRAEEIARTMLELTRLTAERVASGPLPLGLSPYQACILASIVEREARLAEERPLVASVFLNRLERRMRLESCATVLYALPEFKERLTNEDLKVNSPYNTYQNPGLPPTPIANFGKAALAAVASPAETDFLFFVSDASGGHRFSRTLAEHDRSKRLFFQERRRRQHNAQNTPR